MFTISPDANIGLVTTGILAILLEFVRPGWVIPAVTGCTLVAFGMFGLAQYPVDRTSLCLLAAGFVLCGLEGRFQTRGLLGVAGAACLFEGTRWLVAGYGSSDRVHPAVALAASLPVATLLSILLTLGWRARRMKRVTIF